MPTIVRFLTTLMVLAALVVAAMFYLGNFVTPAPREMSERIPASRLDPVPIIRPQPAPEPEESAGADADGPAE